MPLEFPCPNCQHLLRTADDKAGLSATCPACGESIWVPYPHQITGPSELDDSGERYELDGDDSFAPAPAAGPELDDPFAEDAAADPGTYSLARPDDEPPAGATRAVTCDHCGTENEPDARQCRACAADLVPPAPPEATPRPDGGQPRDPDLGEILESSWKIFVEEIGLLIGAFLLVGLMGLGMFIVCFIPAGIGAAIAAAIDDEFIPLGAIAGSIVSLPVWIILASALGVGYLQLNLNVARGVQAGIADLFYGFGEGRSQILPIAVVNLLSAVLGPCTCCLGFLVIWPLGFPIVHRRTGVGDGIGTGVELIQKEFVTVLLIGLLFAGAYMMLYVLNMCFYVGTVVGIFVYPFLFTLMAVGYLRMERERIAVDRD